MGRARRKPAKKNTIHFSPWILAGVALIGAIILGAVLLIGKGSSSSSQISVAQALDKFHSGAFILDVRTSEEWNQGHIPGSILIPLDQLPGRLSEVPRDRDMVVVCRTGVRSAQGLQILQQAGFTRAASMTGGMDAWQAAGYPVESQ
ncbi:MAG: rhodanese-like domain-containing protein [Anaerolineales bacterium]|jgi:rhodanese-related sulfurtransferase